MNKKKKERDWIFEIFLLLSHKWNKSEIRKKIIRFEVNPVPISKTYLNYSTISLRFDKLNIDITESRLVFDSNLEPLYPI